MGLLKGLGKVVGTTMLGAAGIASSVLRACASGAGNDELANVIGKVQDKSFNAIQDMWTPDEQKNEAYYEAQEEKSMERAETAARVGAEKRREYERLKNSRNND